MQVLTDLPPFVIDQILGVPDASYLVIKLWICGDKKLHNKLSSGLTFLRLSCHSLGEHLFPRMVSELRSLRHLIVFSRSDLVQEFSEWATIMRSLPTTLEYLAIFCESEFVWNIDIDGRPIETSYARGVSKAIEFETLFPRLRTLSFGSPFSRISSDELSSRLFPALPSSLTQLEGPIEMDYIHHKDHLSLLPPSICNITGPVTWMLDTDSESKAALDAIRSDFANAPPSLVAFYYNAGLRWASDREMEDSSFECWLPKSLLEVNWMKEFAPEWSPALARTMPPNLTSLALQEINIDAYTKTNTNWAADLPKTLTKFVLGPSRFTDLVSYGRFLPRNLKELILITGAGYAFGVFGDWSKITGIDYWPSKLTTLLLYNFWIEPTDLAKLPRTAETLRLSVSTVIKRARIEDQPKLDSALLPPSVTDLELDWTSLVSAKLDLRPFNLKKCTLSFPHGGKLPCHALAFVFPPTLVQLRLNNVLLDPSVQGYNPSYLPNLTALGVQAVWCTALEQLPRNLRHLVIDHLLEVEESPLVTEGTLFKSLPTSLETLRLLGTVDEVSEDFELPPQSLDHLTSLTDLCILCAPKISSGMLRTLPSSIKRLQLGSTEMKEEDLPYLPPRLDSCFVPNVTPALARCVSLAALSQFGLANAETALTGEALEIGRERVRLAALHQ